MRHADIKTTKVYYVEQDAADIADDLWRGHSVSGGSGVEADFPSHERT